MKCLFLAPLGNGRMCWARRRWRWALFKDLSILSLVKKWNPSPLACPPLAYQPIGGLVKLVRHKNDSLEVLQLTKLTMARKLVVWPRTLDAHKKFIMLVLDNSKINQLDTLIRAGLKGDMGMHGMIELDDGSCRQRSLQPTSLYWGRNTAWTSLSSAWRLPLLSTSAVPQKIGIARMIHIQKSSVIKVFGLLYFANSL